MSELFSSTLRHSRCLAFDRHAGVLCSQSPASADSKWCLFHEEMQAKLLKSYKRRTLAIDTFANEARLPTQLDVMEQETSLDNLRKWSDDSRVMWALVKRAIKARFDHHDIFYSGGDWGHSLFVESLQNDANRLEDTLSVLDRRAYELTLLNSKAEWILVERPISNICETDSTPEPTLPPSPPISEASLPGSSKRSSKKSHKKTSKSPSSSSASDFDCLCCKSVPPPMLSTLEKLASLKAYFQPPAGLLPSITPETWHRFVSHLFRYAILRVPSLATLALAPYDGTVEDFLKVVGQRVQDRGGDEIDLLWRTMKFAKSLKKKCDGVLSVGVIAETIAELSRVEDGDQGFIELLDGRVYKEASKAGSSREGWDLFYSLVSCYGCSLAVTYSFTDWIQNRRLAVLGRYIDWRALGETPSHQLLKVAGVLLCGDNSMSCSRSIKRVPAKLGKKTVLVEDWERAWMYCKLPRQSTSTSEFLELLSTSKQLVFTSRDATTEEISSHPTLGELRSRRCKCCCPGEEIWLKRVRSGFTPAERRCARWTTSTHLLGDAQALESFANNYSPERRYGREFKDVVEVLILDDRKDTEPSDWYSFSATISGLIARSRGFESPEDFLKSQSWTDSDEPRGAGRKLFRELEN